MRRIEKKKTNYPKDGEKKLQEIIQKLRSHNRKLQKENKILKEDNRQMEQVIGENFNLINELTKFSRLEELIK